MFRGDDFGGHNIPYPHPVPPMPHSQYQQDAFIELGKYYDNMEKGIRNGDTGGYSMEPHGQAGWTPDKAYKGETLMRDMGKRDQGKNRGYADVQSYGNSGR